MRGMAWWTEHIETEAGIICGMKSFGLGHDSNYRMCVNVLLLLRCGFNHLYVLVMIVVVVVSHTHYNNEFMTGYCPSRAVTVATAIHQTTSVQNFRARP